MAHIHILFDPIGGADALPFCPLRPEGVRRPGGRIGGAALSELARALGAEGRGGAGGAGEPV